MEVTDLMFGDYVNTPRGNYKVTTIQDNDVIFTDYADDIDGACDIDKVEPIPLTPEILETNGFEEVEDYYTYPTYEFRGIERCVVRVAFPKDSNKTKYDKPFTEIDSEQCWIAHVDTEYVHELQHTLRLCKIDKEIIL